LSPEKLLAEGTPEEVQTILGWIVNTRSLSIALPADKFIAWQSDLDELIRKGHCTHESLHSIVGRLNHSAFIIPLARHFLGRLWALLDAKANKRRRIRLSLQVLSDLDLWKSLLQRAHQGISLNLITTRQPTRICFSDSCPIGIGGWNLRGKAWRIRIPRSSPLFGSRRINNFLEFLGMAINIRLECNHPEWAGGTDDEPCILALGDNTSAIGWLHRTSHLTPDSAAHAAHLALAHDLAQIVLDANACLASQHVKGEDNFVADLLSFAGSDREEKPHPIAFDDPDNTTLTQRFHEYYPSQIPENFEISQLPSEILSWASLALQTVESFLTLDRKEATRTETVSGVGGSGLHTEPESPVTPSSLLYPQHPKTSSSGPSFLVTELPSGPPMGAFVASVRDRWSQALCAMPQATWLRRFGSITNQAPCTSKGCPTCSPPSETSSLPFPMSTPPNSDNARSPPNCCDQCTVSPSI
jgi:hypothetical protein